MSERIEYPPEPEPGESRLEWERRALNPWRMDLKRRMLAERGPMCDRGCGRQAEDLDESILPRVDMGGLSLEQRRLAFSSANAELACSRCNREEAHDREAAWRRAVVRYGSQTMMDWYTSLNLKAPRREWLPPNR